jgi:hypothetical protein
VHPMRCKIRRRVSGRSGGAALTARSTASANGSIPTWTPVGLASRGDRAGAAGASCAMRVLLGARNDQSPDLEPARIEQRRNNWQTEPSPDVRPLLMQDRSAECLNVGPAVPNPSLDLLIRRTASLRPLIRKGASRELPTFGQLSVRKELNVIPARSACRGNRTVPVTALAGVPSITTSPTTTPFFRTGCCPDATRQ